MINNPQEKNWWKKNVLIMFILLGLKMISLKKVGFNHPDVIVGSDYFWLFFWIIFDLDIPDKICVLNVI